MPSFLETFPFPFNTPAGQELWRTLAGIVPVPLDAIALAEKFDVDPFDLPVNLTPRQLWRVILEKTAAKGQDHRSGQRTCSRRIRATGKHRSSRT
jgi:hypothetical protein